jgi:hypothetical protein
MGEPEIKLHLLLRPCIDTASQDQPWHGFRAGLNNGLVVVGNEPRQLRLALGHQHGCFAVPGVFDHVQGTGVACVALDECRIDGELGTTEIVCLIRFVIVDA